ncbi:molybdenum cofactor guanylyltransferase MobA [Simiduia curdlanivorans]|uniref:Molybdenum cofactor guanylyltransferase n=1 Tax=Simiduia curdlanivorans TaxID=1492769 RepID=A0ABV8V977_9GAMM|nr:molybdenum cofactor guanylyltransferase MobA [Simiduia curdlanivorans]MDN3639043.1 molybdenum cofactor guanylyltransferase MobA [Simiduia curdlanivorans]
MKALKKENIAGLIVAGGQGLRMGKTDKCLLNLDNKTLLQCCVDRLSPQVNVLALNANGQLDRFNDALKTLALMPMLPDMPPSAGPISGIIAGLTWLQQQPEQWLVTIAADTPFFPLDLVTRLSQGLGVKTPLAVASDSHGMHPLFGLWHKDLLPRLQQALAQDQCRLQQLINELGGIQVDFSGCGPEAFFNINTPEDWARAQAQHALTAK